MYVYIYIYIYVYTHTYMCVCIYIYICIITIIIPCLHSGCHTAIRDLLVLPFNVGIHIEAQAEFA